MQEWERNYREQQAGEKLEGTNEYTAVVYHELHTCERTRTMPKNRMLK